MRHKEEKKPADGKVYKAGNKENNARRANQDPELVSGSSGTSEVSPSPSVEQQKVNDLARLLAQKDEQLQALQNKLQKQVLKAEILQERVQELTNSNQELAARAGDLEQRLAACRREARLKETERPTQQQRLSQSAQEALGPPGVRRTLSAMITSGLFGSAAAVLRGLPAPPCSSDAGRNRDDGADASGICKEVQPGRFVVLLPSGEADQLVFHEGQPLCLGKVVHRGSTSFKLHYYAVPEGEQHFVPVVNESGYPVIACKLLRGATVVASCPRLEEGRSGGGGILPLHITRQLLSSVASLKSEPSTD